MPKMIGKAAEMLLAEARKQVEERGYGKTTIRSVAGACGIAVGTVYNYFPSKEVLIATFVAEDWRECLAEMSRQGGADAKTLLHAIYDGYRSFAGKHHALFTDPDAAKAVSGVFLSRHLQLREQIAALIEPVAPSEDGFTAQFIAEAMLAWTISNVPFDRIYELLAKTISESKEDAYEQF